MSSPHKPSRHGNTEQIHCALSHPLRTAILATMLQHGPLSASGFLKKGAPKKIGLKVISYHLRVLEKAKVIVVREELKKRGATESIFALDPTISAELIQLVASTNGYLVPDTRDQHEGSRTKVVHLGVDDLGREEVAEASRDFSERLARADAASRQRLSSSAQDPRPLQVVFTEPDENR